MIKEEEIFISPTSDIFIKYLFGMDTDDSNQLVLSFINAVLEDADFQPVVRILQKNPFNYKEFKNDKLSVLDIQVEDEKGKIYNIEVQTYTDRKFQNRALYYWSKLYTSQLSEGDKYKRLHPVISINILEFELLPELPGFHNFFLITEGRYREYVLTDHLVIHFLELSKLKESGNSSKIEKWMLYLKAEGRNSKMLKILLKDDEDLQKAHNKYETFTSDKDLRFQAISREKFVRDQLSREGAAHDAGAYEKSLETARVLKESDVSMDIILKSTGLTIEEIENI